MGLGLEYRPANTPPAQEEASMDVNRASAMLAGSSARRESRGVQTRSEATHIEILVSTQGPIPPSHPLFPHQLQCKELMWTRLPLVLLWGQHWARLLLQTVAGSPSTQPTCCTFQAGTNQKNQETFVKLRFAQSGLQVPPFLHLNTSLPLPLSPEHESHIQGITIDVCNQIPTKQGLSTALILICQDTKGAHPYSPFITPGQKQNKNTPIRNCFNTHALRALPVTLISDPPSCHSACLILRGLQMQAFFRVLDCLCAE